MDSTQIKKLLLTHFPESLIDHLIETYEEIKKNFYLSNLRPNEVEGGRFAEAVFRMLEHVTTSSFTPLNKQLDTERIIKNLSNLPSLKFSDSIRLHIPRTLRVIYDIRNKRDAAHLADGIDPNLQDAAIVCACADWVLSEIVRLYHGIHPNQAQKIVDNLVTRKAPVIEDFGEMLKTLNPKLLVSERILVLLYHQGAQGASFEQLRKWVKPAQRPNLNRTLTQLEHEKDLVVHLKDKYKITLLGKREVEIKKLLKPLS